MTTELIKEILDSSKDSKSIIKQISSTPLPNEVLKFTKRYEENGGKRDAFLWKWAKSLENSGLVFSCVDKEIFDSVVNKRILMTLLVSILDDTADYYKNKELLDSLLEIVLDGKGLNRYSNLSESNLAMVELSMDLFSFINNSISEYPNYSQLEHSFRYDLKQTLNSFDFSYLVNTEPLYNNLKDVYTYCPHNMAFFLYHDIDLMASTEFDLKELPLVREVIRKSQLMARIGNWLSTSKRELHENDFSSALFAYALSVNIIDLADLEEKKVEKMERVVLENPRVINHFLNEWERNYREIETFAPKIKSLDVNRYLEGLKTLMLFHLVSIGLK